MQTVKVHFDNGDSLVTDINGTPEEIRAYYLGRTYNLGSGDNDVMAKAVRVEFPAFRVGARVHLSFSADVTGTISSEPVQCAGTRGLSYLVKLDKGMWNEKHDIYLSTIAIHEDNLRLVK